MPSKTLALLLFPAALLGVTAYPVRTSTVATTDVQLFANAFLSSATGGKFDDCSDVSGQFRTTLSLGLGIGTSAVARAIAFNRWAAGYCFSNYHDTNLCAEISAYLSATYYAYENAWAGAELFASLGSTRVNRWHDLLTGLCESPSAPASACTDLTTQWNDFYTSYTDTALSISTNAYAQLDEAGILSMIDAAAILDGTLHLGTRGLLVGAYESGSAAISGAIDGGLGLVAAGSAKVLGDGPLIVAADAVAGLNAGPLGVGALAAGKANVFTKRDILANVDGALDAFADLHLGDETAVDAIIALEGKGHLLVGHQINLAADAIADLKIGDLISAAISDKAEIVEQRDLFANIDAGLHAATGLELGDDDNNIVADIEAELNAKADLLVNRDIILTANEALDAKLGQDISVGIAGHVSGLDSFKVPRDLFTSIDADLGLDLPDVFADIKAQADADVQLADGGLNINAQADVDAAAKVDLRRDLDLAGQGAADIFGALDIGHESIVSELAANGAGVLDIGHDGIVAAGHGDLFGGLSLKKRFLGVTADADASASGAVKLGGLPIGGPVAAPLSSLNDLDGLDLSETTALTAGLLAKLHLRDTSLDAFGDGSLDLGSLIDAEGEGLLVANKQSGIVAAGEGHLNIAGIDLSGSGAAVLY